MSFEHPPTAVNAVTSGHHSRAIIEETKGTAIVNQQEEEIEEGLKFRDFEIIKVLGEGSFGKVFKVRKRDSGKVYAMKSMSKKQLINNNQVRYAVTEA